MGMNWAFGMVGSPKDTPRASRNSFESRREGFLEARPAFTWGYRNPGVRKDQSVIDVYILDPIDSRDTRVRGW
jgi:hypothetical protein